MNAISPPDDLPLSLSRDGFRLNSLFPTPVAVAPVNEAATLNPILRDLILARRASCAGVSRSNEGGWQSTDDFAGWAGAPGRRLVALARALADQLTGIEDGSGLRREPLDWTINAWANVSEAGSSNRPHHHPGAFWSGVYWIDAGDDAAPATLGGELEMQDPRGILPGFAAPLLRYAAPGCLSAGGSEFLNPVPGTLVLFPSWLVHAVRPYRGTARRISVAFNFAA